MKLFLFLLLAAAPARAITYVTYGGGGTVSTSTVYSNVPATFTSSITINDGGAGGLLVVGDSVTAGGFFGDGSNLTGLYCSSGTAIGSILCLDPRGGATSVSSAGESTVSGGGNNSALGPGDTVAGGDSNVANGEYSFVAGLSNQVSGSNNTISGGNGNSATGTYDAIPGGTGNIVGGTGSLAAGSHANVANDGAFVWGDNSGSSCFDNGTNSFTVCAGGGSFDSGSLVVNFDLGNLDPSFQVDDANGSPALQVSNGDGNGDYVQTLNNILDDGGGDITAQGTITASNASFGGGDVLIGSDYYGQIDFPTANGPVYFGTFGYGPGAATAGVSIPSHVVFGFSAAVPRVGFGGGYQWLGATPAALMDIWPDAGDLGVPTVSIQGVKQLNHGINPFQVTDSNYVPYDWFDSSGGFHASSTTINNTLTIISTETIKGNAFSVGGSSFVVTAGSATLAFRFSPGSMALTGSTGTYTSVSSVTAGAFFGDGSHLTGISAGGETNTWGVGQSSKTFTGEVQFSSSIYMVSGTSISANSFNLFMPGSGHTQPVFRTMYDSNGDHIQIGSNSNGGLYNDFSMLSINGDSSQYGNTQVEHIFGTFGNFTVNSYGYFDTPGRFCLNCANEADPLPYMFQVSSGTIYVDGTGGGITDAAGAFSVGGSTFSITGGSTTVGGLLHVGYVTTNTNSCATATTCTATCAAGTYRIGGPVCGDGAGVGMGGATATPTSATCNSLTLTTVTVEVDCARIQ
jgi:hypothetical protein